MKLSVSLRGNLSPSVAVALLALAVPSLAQHRIPIVPPNSVLEAQRIKDMTTVDRNSVNSVKQRLERLRAVAKMRAAGSHATKTTAKAYVPSADGSMTEKTVERYKVPGGGWAGAQLYYLQQRAYPNDRLDPNALIRAAEQRDKLPAPKLILKEKARKIVPQGAKAGQVDSAKAIIPPDDTPIVDDNGEQTSNLRWQQMGPGGYNGGQVSWRIGGLDYDPNDPTKIYAATPKGGVWRSNNNGQSWTPLTDREFGLCFSSVAVSPFDSTVIFAGSGDYDGGNGPGFGILKSTDGGATWKIYGKAEFGTQAIRRVLPHPFWSNIVFATGGRNGLFRSIDEGETWTRVLEAGAGSVSNVTFNSNFGVMYASVDDVGIFRSTNDGQTWEPMPGAPTGAGRFDVATSILTSLRKRKTLYVMHGAGGGSSDGVISKGEPPIDNDNGDIGFTALTNSPRGNVGGRPVWDQKFYNFFIGTSSCVVLDPGKPADTPPIPPRNVAHDVVYIGLIQVWMSQNSGALWHFVPTHHVDQHSITLSPFNINEVLQGSDGGVRKLVYTPGPERYHLAQPNPETPPVPNPWVPERAVGSWRQTLHNNGLAIAQFYDSGFSPDNVNEGLGGTQDNGSQFSNNSADWFDVSGGDGGGCGINFQNPLIQYSSNQVQTGPDFYPINLTLDAWDSSFNISIFTNGDVNPFIAMGTINAGNPSKFMYGTNFLYEFDSDVFQWRKFRQRFSETGYVIGAAAAPSNPNYIYAGTSDGRFWYSADAGRNFTRIDRVGQGGLPGRAVTDIRVSPSNPKKVYITVSGTGGAHVYRCDDVTRRPAVWSSMSNGLPDIYTNAIELIHRSNESAAEAAVDREMFVGTDVGVFYTDDGGRNWYNATRTMGLPNVDVRSMTYYKDSGYLHIATYGRGMWKLNIADSVIGAGDVLFKIQANLDSYRGDKSQLTARVEFLSGGAVVKSSNVRLTAAGYIIAPTELAGTFDIRVTIPGFLRRKVEDVYVGDPNQPALILNFVAGDVNADNIVNETDLNNVQALMGQIWNGVEDVDGDRRITINDTRIIQRNLGKTGD